MITVEELIVSSLYHRLVLVSVKRTPDPPGEKGNESRPQTAQGQGDGDQNNADQAQPTANTKDGGLGFLFMGAMSPEVRKAFTRQPAAQKRSEAIKDAESSGDQQLASADTRALLKALGESGEEVQFSRNVQTVLDTSEIQMVSSMVESSETQTDFPMVWNFGPSLNYNVTAEGEEGSEEQMLSVSGASSQMMPPINLNNCEGFSIVRLEDIRDPDKGSLVMVQTSKGGDPEQKRRELESAMGLLESAGGYRGSESQRSSCTSEMLQISTGPSTEGSPRASPTPSPTMTAHNTAVYVRPAEPSPARSQASSGDRGEIDSGIWDMIQGLENKTTITEHDTAPLTQPAPHRGRFVQVDDDSLASMERAREEATINGESQIKPTKVTGAYRKYHVGPGGDAKQNGLDGTSHDMTNGDVSPSNQLSLPVDGKHSLDRGDSNETSTDTVVGLSPNEDLAEKLGAITSQIVIAKIPSRPPSRSVSPRLEEVAEAKAELYSSQLTAGRRPGAQSPMYGSDRYPEFPPPAVPDSSHPTESSESNTSSPGSLTGRYRMFSVNEKRPSNRLHESLHRASLQGTARGQQQQRGPDAEIKFVIQSSESEFSADTSTSSSVTELSPLKSSPIKPARASERMTQSLTYEHRSADGSMCTSENIYLTECAVEQEFMSEIYEGRRKEGNSRRPRSTAGLNYLPSDKLESAHSSSSPAREKGSGLNVMSDLFTSTPAGSRGKTPVPSDLNLTPTEDREGRCYTTESSPSDGGAADSDPRFHKYENVPRHVRKTRAAASNAGILLHEDHQGNVAIASRREKRQSAELSSLESSHMFDSDLALDTFADDMSMSEFDVSAYEGPAFNRHADWMKNLPVDKHSIPLTQLTIPGSHISLAIDKDMRTDMDFSKCNYEMADFLRKLPPLSVFNNFRSLMKKIWKAWMPKQMLSVYHQLEAGARFLDIRITKFRGAFYGEHGLYTKQFRSYLKEIRQFLNYHPQEIVILHFHSLNQLEKGDKRRLVTQLFQVFGARLARVCDVTSVSLLSLWRHKKQVLVIFPQAELDALDNHIFAGLVWSDRHLLGTDARQQAVTELVDYLQLKYVTDKPYLGTDRFYLHQAVLSPDMTMVFGDFQYKSMRELHIEETSGAVTSWVEGKRDLNIVIVDFVGIGDLVSHIIRLNYPPKKETMV